MQLSLIHWRCPEKLWAVAANVFIDSEGALSVIRLLTFANGSWVCWKISNNLYWSNVVGWTAIAKCLAARPTANVIKKVSYSCYIYFSPLRVRGGKKRLREDNLWVASCVVICPIPRSLSGISQPGNSLSAQVFTVVSERRQVWVGNKTLSMRWFSLERLRWKNFSNGISAL